MKAAAAAYPLNSQVDVQTEEVREQVQDSQSRSYCSEQDCI